MGGVFSSLSSIAPNSLDSLRHTDPQVANTESNLQESLTQQPFLAASESHQC